MIKYYCNKCKTFIIDSSVIGSDVGWSNLSHEIQWKNGVTWYRDIHKVVKVIVHDQTSQTPNDSEASK